MRELGCPLLFATFLFLLLTESVSGSDCLTACSGEIDASQRIFGYSYEAIRTYALALSGPAAVITLIATWRNVNASKKQQRASALFDLDARWESDALKQSKKDAYEMLTTAIRYADNTYGTYAFENEVSPTLKNELRTLEIYNQEKHNGLMDILSFMETIGHATRNRYIPLSDVVNLFGGAILSMRLLFKAHIEDMQNQDENSFANTMWLFHATQAKVNRQAGRRRLRRRFSLSCRDRGDRSETG